MRTRRCARLMIVNERAELLLFEYKDEHREEPFWATVGGELQHDENYLDAAKRELFEETGLTNEIGELLMKRESVFAVARSIPALWKERYYLVRCSSRDKIIAAKWTEEEKSTIQSWKWWSLDEMRHERFASFKPDSLEKLLQHIIEGDEKEDLPHSQRDS